MKHVILLGLCAWALLGISGCGSDGDPPEGGTEAAGTTGVTGSGASGGAGGSGTTASTGAVGGAGGVGGGVGGGGGTGNFPLISCSVEAPEGAAHAPPPPAYSGGECPALATGFNTITSSGNAREFRLVLPADLDPAERLPVVFLWHWMGGSADGFYERGEVQAAVDTQRFIAVIPEAKGDINVFGLELQWPYDVTQSAARIEEEFVFFDDMLACVAEQVSINNDCVASAGVSAGALFTGQLAGGRGQYLSSILSLSGGVGGNLIKGWTQPEHRMPAMVLWGGDTDACFGLMNFVETSQELETSLTAGGHFFLECIHNCGHAQPPLDVPPGLSAFAALWQFVFDHPYWLKPGESPYLQGGITPSLPMWCGIGAGSATPRTGECLEPPGC
jgi:predicted esterase